MSFQTLSERLTALQETTRQVEELISRLANLKFQPGTVPLDNEEGDVGAELSNEIHQTLKEQAEDLELLQQEVEDLPPGRHGTDREARKAALKEDVRAAGRQLKTAWASFRRAQLAAKQSREAAQQAERALLLTTLTSLADPLSSSTDSLPLRRSTPHPKPAPLSPDEKLIAASSDVTAALRRTHLVMQTELSRSQFAHDTLKESTAALTQLSESYSTLDTLLSSSRSLLGTLLKSQKSDTWYLETAFYLLLATVGWLVFRRLVYGPAWWLVWVPLKLFYKAWMGVFTAVGIRGSRDGVFASSAGTSGGVGMTVLEGGARPMATMSGGVDVPVVNVGEAEKKPEEGGEGSMVDEVGKIIDESREEPGTDKIQKNPKKRMWEEDKEAKKYEQQKKDEL